MIAHAPTQPRFNGHFSRWLHMHPPSHVLMAVSQGLPLDFPCPVCILLWHFSLTSLPPSPSLHLCLVLSSSTFTQHLTQLASSLHSTCPMLHRLSVDAYMEIMQIMHKQIWKHSYSPVEIFSSFVSFCRQVIDGIYINFPHTTMSLTLNGAAYLV